MRIHDGLQAWKRQTLYNEKRFTPLKTNVEPELLVHFPKGKTSTQTTNFQVPWVKFGGSSLPACAKCYIKQNLFKPSVEKKVLQAYNIITVTSMNLGVDLHLNMYPPLKKREHGQQN